ncbi:adenosylcobinamide-phosphate synthase CbiB [Halovivax limisalsi]|uniref:adenosylcobinamide-phosphate synthase CbiB n=1 Tax=Halovivax limisalsi TaxID=1453760 RepID=UPI001FFDA99E|nr:adenosylcobinamide-phosphate synthase CbiB [Halovivax limisalsi]
MTATTLAIVGVAVGLDRLIGEPPTRVHPVAWLGRLVAHLDRDWPLGPTGHRRVGLAVALCVPVAAAGVVGGLVALAASLHPVAAAALAAFALFLTTSLRALLDLTETVVDRSETAPDAARESVRGLVGRDPSDLTPGDLRSAAIESATENLADGFVAAFVPFVLLTPHSLPVAAAVATWIKAVNTLDSMLGYPSKPIGTASARLDDLVMWLPARVSAGAIALAAGDPASLGRARRWARATPSPNAGWPMAVGAAVLDVRLEKPGVYTLHPSGETPTRAAGERAVALVGRAAAIVIATTLVVSIGLDVGLEAVAAGGST